MKEGKIMLFKKVIDICKKRGIVHLYNGDDAQWISDGATLQIC